MKFAANDDYGRNLLTCVGWPAVLRQTFTPPDRQTPPRRKCSAHSKFHAPLIGRRSDIYSSESQDRRNHRTDGNRFNNDSAIESRAVS